jgi:IS30 family transposase
MGKHLTYEQRSQIYVLLRQGLSQAAIAAAVGSEQSVISRELIRNCGQRGYRYKLAQEKADNRRKAASSGARKMTEPLIAKIERRLREEQLSPEQISGRLAAEEDIRISHEWIYRHIWADKQAGGSLHECLRRSGKKYNKRKGKNSGRGLIPGRVDISDRPAIVEAKTRIGDWEADTIVGAAHKGGLLSLVDRVTRYTLLAKLDAITADLTCAAMIAKMSPYQDAVLTITADNGKEFACHQRIADGLKASFYFATPYHAWERGLNENTNGLVRQYFPKGTNFSNVTEAHVARVQNLLNTRPRKILGFKSPSEVFLPDL